MRLKKKQKKTKEATMTAATLAKKNEEDITLEAIMFDSKI